MLTVLGLFVVVGGDCDGFGAEMGCGWEGCGNVAKVWEFRGCCWVLGGRLDGVGVEDWAWKRAIALACCVARNAFSA